MLDLGAYLQRIRLSGARDVAGVHRAHATSIPFENLSPRCGVPVSLEPGDVERKLVAERRGGYCFEQNLLLAAALRELGSEVRLHLARARLGFPAGEVRPRSHLVLSVRDRGEWWLADVGFGNGTLLEPIPFGPGDEHAQAGWGYRMLAEGREIVLQRRGAEGWDDLYAMPPEPVPEIDVQTINWWTSTSPSSPFVSRLLVCALSADGSGRSLSDRSGQLTLVERSPSGKSARAVPHSEFSTLLAERFGLPGFAMREDGSVFAERGA